MSNPKLTAAQHATLARTIRDGGSALLPFGAACPFCAHADSLYETHVPGTIIHPAFYVNCDNCGAQGPTSDRGDHVALWNNRPTEIRDGL